MIDVIKRFADKEECGYTIISINNDGLIHFANLFTRKAPHVFIDEKTEMAYLRYQEGFEEDLNMPILSDIEKKVSCSHIDKFIDLLFILKSKEKILHPDTIRTLSYNIKAYRKNNQNIDCLFCCYYVFLAEKGFCQFEECPKWKDIFCETQCSTEEQGE